MFANHQIRHQATHKEWWAVSLGIADGYLIFLKDLRGYALVDMVTLQWMKS